MADTFFVFGPMGQIYRGGAQGISQVLPVQAVQRPQAVRRSNGVQQLPSGAPPKAHATAAAALPPRWQEAVRAYVQTEQPAPAERRPLTQVRDVMTPHAISVHPDERANDAWQMLAERQVAQAPVVDAQGHVVGLLLRADLAPEQLLPAAGDVQNVQKAIALARRPVSEVMVSPVPTVAPDTSLRRVAQVLLQTGLPGLPVTDAQGTLQGFISRTDILRAVAADPPLDLWVGPAPA